MFAPTKNSSTAQMRETGIWPSVTSRKPAPATIQTKADVAVVRRRGPLHDADGHEHERPVAQHLAAVDEPQAVERQDEAGGHDREADHEPRRDARLVGPALPLAPFGVRLRVHGVSSVHNLR